MAWPKESRHARGYGSAWDKLRLVILKRDKYLCQCDQCKGGKLGGRLTAASEVNHRVPKADFASGKVKGNPDDPDDPSNLHAINSDCHKRVTAEQQGKSLRPRIGLDGWPMAT